MSSKTRELRTRLEEITRRKNELSAAESNLKEQKKIRARLKADEERKNQRLNSAQEDIDREIEEFRWKKEKLLSKMKAKEVSFEVTTKKLREAEEGLLVDVAAFDVLQSRNEKLQNRLKTLAQEFYALSTKLYDEREKKKQMTFDMRMRLDQMLRQVIKKQRLIIEEESVKYMEAEAENARLENIKMSEEWKAREDKCIALIRQQQASYERLTKVRVEREVTVNNTKMQEKSLEALKKHTSSQKQEVEILTDITTSIENELHELEMQLQFKAGRIEELKNLENKLRKTKTERKRLCKESILLAQKLATKGLEWVSHSSKHGGLLVSTSPDVARRASGMDEVGSLLSSLEGALSESTKRRSNNITTGTGTTGTPCTRSTPATSMPRQQRPAEVDDERVWNSKLSESHIFSVKLRKLIRRSRQKEAPGARLFDPTEASTLSFSIIGEEAEDAELDSLS